MNKFKPDWDVMAVMVEEQQLMAKKIEELEARIAEYRNPQQRRDLMEQGGRGGCKRENVKPKKEWVGLTYADLYFWGGELGLGELGKGVLRAVDAHLREKNT